MWDNIPLEIQVEIIKRVPVKSLIRFRSVSRQWKSLINSPGFITDHSVNQTQSHHLLVRCTVASEQKYVWVFDDDSFPQHKFSHTISPIDKLVSHPFMLDCSHGLVCLYGFSVELATYRIVVWNPAIRKSVEIALPSIKSGVGFGVCPKTSDPKIVVVTRGTAASIDLKAEVFTLSSGTWRPISIGLLEPLGSYGFRVDQVVIDGIIYWATYNYSGYSDKIISFDLASEEFGVIEFPDSLTHHVRLYISKLKESLVVLNHDRSALVCDVWMMHTNGDPISSSLTKLFTVSFKASGYSIIGFRKNGQLIIKHVDEHNGVLVTMLEVYEPGVESNNYLEIDLPYMTTYDPFFVTTSYSESLLLLNHSGSIIQL